MGCAAAVKLVPPHADQVLLMKDGSVRAQEVVSFVVGADMEDLALSFYVSVVTRVLLLVAAEGCLRDLGENRVVLAWSSRDG